MITVSQINIYPLKSAAPVSLEKSLISKRGIVNDRRWMLIDNDGVALTARDCPALLRVKSNSSESGITFSSLEASEIELKIPSGSNQKTTVDIWSTKSPATLVSDQADKWFCEYLQVDCRLVYMREEDTRAVEPKVGGLEGDVVSFADENPLLLITEASLSELNNRLQNPITMLNFRPNIVIKGSQAFAEDNWNRVKIGDAVYRVAQVCKRCNLTTIDPESALFRDDGEPLKALAKFRYDPARSGVLFGIHLIPETEASEIRNGDQLIVAS